MKWICVYIDQRAIPHIPAPQKLLYLLVSCFHCIGWLFRYAIKVALLCGIAFDPSFTAVRFLMQLINFCWYRTADATAGNNRSSIPTDRQTNEGVEASPFGDFRRRWRPGIQPRQQPILFRSSPHRIIRPLLSYSVCIYCRQPSPEFVPVHRLPFLDSIDIDSHSHRSTRPRKTHSTAKLFRMVTQWSSWWDFQRTWTLFMLLLTHSSEDILYG